MAARKTYILKLYVAGKTANWMRALNTLREILENEFKGVYALKVIDVLKQPQLAEEDKILATPTLAKILPPTVSTTPSHKPLSISFGSLSNSLRFITLLAPNDLNKSGPAL